MTSGASTGVTTYTTPSDREVVPPYVSKEARDAALDTGAMDGMNRAFELLDELLDTQR